MHTNAYRTAAKSDNFASISYARLQFDQRTRTMVNALVDCQLVRTFWANVLTDSH
jgi:hypothetical protein